MDSSEVEFWVYDTTDGALGTTVRGKVFKGSLRIGDVFQRVVVADRRHAVSLQVDEISVFGTLLDEVDTGLSAHLLVTGHGAELLAHDALAYLT